MNLFRALTEKSWETSPEAPAETGFSVPPQKVALLLFLAVVTIMFGLFVAAYFHGAGRLAADAGISAALAQYIPAVFEQRRVAVEPWRS